MSADDGRLAVRKTYKLYVGGAFPRSESGRTYEVTGRDGRFLANAALASRKDARDAVVAARKAFGGLVGGHGLQPGPGAVPGGRDAGGPARPVRGRGGRGRRPLPRQGGRPRSTPPSTAGSGTPDGATRSPRSTGPPTRWPAPTSTSRCPSRPAWWRSSPPPARRCWGSCRWWRP